MFSGVVAHQGVNVMLAEVKTERLQNEWIMSDLLQQHNRSISVTWQLD